MKFRQLIAKYVTGNLSTYKLPDIGVVGLQEGLDSDSLRILAGLSKYESAYKVDHYFMQALRELNIIVPDRRQAAIDYAIALVDEIVEGKEDVIAGTREIREDAIHSYDFYSEDKHYAYDGIGFEKAYGLFDTFDELSSAHYRWQTDKTNEELMQQVKAELLEELKRWRDKLQSGVYASPLA